MVAVEEQLVLRISPPLASLARGVKGLGKKRPRMGCRNPWGERQGKNDWDENTEGENISHGKLTPQKLVNKKRKNGWWPMS